MVIAVVGRVIAIAIVVIMTVIAGIVVFRFCNCGGSCVCCSLDASITVVAVVAKVVIGITIAFVTIVNIVAIVTVKANVVVMAGMAVIGVVPVVTVIAVMIIVAGCCRFYGRRRDCCGPRSGCGC